MRKRAFFRLPSSPLLVHAVPVCLGLLTSCYATDRGLAPPESAPYYPVGLATSPGGVDSIAVIAATSTVDTSFVMVMQLARFLVVLLAGPLTCRWLARLVPPAASG